MGSSVGSAEHLETEAQSGRMGEDAFASAAGLWPRSWRQGLRQIGRQTARRLKPWLLRCWQRSAARPARLKLIERMQLGPKQTLVLIEADGARLLVASSTEGTPAFFSLGRAEGRQGARLEASPETLGWRRTGRRSW